MASTLRLAGGLLAAATAVSGSWLPNLVIKDVAVIGGGASGAYAAVRLKEDFGKSIVLVEKADRLGGHVSTYDDPVTGKSYDFGVQTFNDYGPARDFFDRMQVPLGMVPRVPLVSQYADFTTGAAVNFTPPANPDRAAALQTFLDVTAPWEDYFLPGYWNFPDPDDIPDDLLLPFGDFVTKHGIEAAVHQVFQVTGMGVGNMMATPTLYVLEAFGQPMLRAFMGQGATISPASGRNIQLYEAVQARLGDDVLLSTTVTQSLRTPLGHTLWVKSSTGENTIILCRRLLIAIEPTPANMQPFNLDLTEQSALSKFGYTTVHAGIVSHPSLPVNGSVVNTPAASAPDNYVVLPQPDFNVRFDYLGGDLFRVLMVGDQAFTKADAQQLVRDNVASLVNAGTLPPSGPNPGDEVIFRAWADHGAMHMKVPESELRTGFIQKLYALQGRRETWWTGGAFSVQFQSILWAFDDILLPKMFE